jgi:hypothetical protein
MLVTMYNILVYNWLCVVIDLSTLIIKNCVDTRTSSTHGNLHALARYLLVHYIKCLEKIHYRISDSCSKLINSLLEQLKILKLLTIVCQNSMKLKPFRAQN